MTAFFNVHCQQMQLDPKLHGVCAGYESGKWRAEQLSRYLMEWLPEFCLSYSEHESIKGTNAVSQLRAAAKTVYDTDKYDRRGEFGELLLHALLRETMKTEPAISKIFFKDSVNNTVKGFDAIHVVDTPSGLELWLGEVKFYKDTHLSQEPEERNIFVHTQERVVENPHIKDVDFFVIDEFYKLQIEESAEGDERAVLLNHAFYRLAKRAKQFYMLGPSIHELPDGFGPNYRCVFIRTDFSTVASDSHIVPSGKDDITRLKALVPTLEGPTLVFSGSVNGARRLGQATAESRGKFEAKPGLRAAIEWLGANYSPKWGLVNALSHGVGIHHGKLPRSIAQLLVRLFNGGLLDYLVCTSTLIEGVNTAARNVVVVDNKINKKKYDYFTFNNIRGRSGRMWQHYVGHVYLFNAPPERELEFVDVPVFTQNENAPDALLIQLEQQDLSPAAKERMNQIWQQTVLSRDTIQQNVGMDPLGQIALAKEIEARMGELAPLLSWTGLPTYDQKKAVFDLAWRHFKVKPAGVVRSSSQLTLLISRYQKNPGYSAQLQAAIAGKTGEESDEALESFLEFARQWLSFKAPRLMSAVARIQTEVLTRRGIRPGNYTYFCSQLESLFMNPVVTALEEYGVPIQIGTRLVPKLGEPKSLDEALTGLARRRASEFSGLSAFEQSLIKPLCAPAPGLR